MTNRIKNSALFSVPDVRMLWRAWAGVDDRTAVHWHFAVFAYGGQHDNACVSIAGGRHSLFTLRTNPAMRWLWDHGSISFSS
jgi:hypothetical protein